MDDDDPYGDLDWRDEPVTEVTIMPALAYDSLVLLFPAHPERGTAEWGVFVSLADARELQRKLADAVKAIDRDATREETQRRRTAGAKLGWEIRRAKQAKSGEG